MCSCYSYCFDCYMINTYNNGNVIKDLNLIPELVFHVWKSQVSVLLECDWLPASKASWIRFDDSSELFPSEWNYETGPTYRTLNIGKVQIKSGIIETAYIQPSCSWNTIMPHVYYTNNSKTPIRKITFPGTVTTKFLFRDSSLILVNSHNMFLAEITKVTYLHCLGFIAYLSYLLSSRIIAKLAIVLFLPFISSILLLDLILR